MFVPEADNNRLWHIPFNRVNDPLTEQLVRGREEAFFGYEFAIQGGGETLPDDVVKYYVRLFSDRDVLRGGFGLYRAWDATIAQNSDRAAQPLPMPVLALGGANSWGDLVGNVNADDLQTVVIPGVGHWLAEQAPEEMLAVLNSFLSPYRDGHPLRTSSVTGALDR
jgi:pimeloyl-ACP methyl ester carboxylesterase